MIQEDDNSEEWHTGKLEYPFGRGINFQIKTYDAQKLIDKLKATNYPIQMDLKNSCYAVKTEFYNYRQFLVMDPDGYLLRFSQPI